MTLLQSLPAVFDMPEVYAALVVVITALVYWQRTLSWREYKILHGLKVRVLPFIDRHTSLFVVSRKGGYEDAEFLCTVDNDVATTFTRLVDAGGSPHLINSIKVRNVNGQNQYSAAHVVFTHDDGYQTEAFLFDDPVSGGCDVYTHLEPGVSTPREHLEGTQTDGDARNVVRDAL